MKKLIAILGKILFALPLLVFGLSHLINAKAMVSYHIVPSYLPYPTIWIILTGVGLILAAISLLVNKYVRISMFLLAVFLLFMIIMVHFPSLSDKQMEPMGLLKDMALMGAALFFGAENT